MYFDRSVSIEIDAMRVKHSSAVSMYDDYDAYSSSYVMEVEEDQMNQSKVCPYWIDENLSEE